MRWVRSLLDAGQRGLDRRIAARFGAPLQPASPNERSIERAVSYLQNDARAKQAIERAGMGVRDFVLMTVALEQEMRVASGRTAEQPPPPMPAPLPYVYPGDTGFTPQPMFPAPSAPVPPSPHVDSSVRIDTVFARPPRDTVRDTTRSLPPDSLPRP